MTRKIAFAGIALCLLVAVAFAQPQQQAPPTDTETPAIAGVVAAGTKVTVIKSGFQGTEGPIGMPDGSLIFTETQANRITRIAADGTTSTFLENTNGSNGLAWDAKGRLISVQTTPGQTKIGVIYPKGSEAMLADNFDGKAFRPAERPRGQQQGRDLLHRAGSQRAARRRRPRRRRRCRRRSTTFRRAVRRQSRRRHPPAEWHHAEPRREDALRQRHARRDTCWRSTCKPTARWPTAATSRSTRVRRRVPNGITSGADGLAIDDAGRIYAATSAGVEVFDANGAHLGTIPVSRAPQNIAFAGNDKKTLYIVGRGSAFKVDVETPGFKGRAK